MNWGLNTLRIIGTRNGMTVACRWSFNISTLLLVEAEDQSLEKIPGSNSVLSIAHP